MNKQEFIIKLCQGLSGFPQDEIEERLTFYSEMIDDRMEEGLSEEEAVLEFGSVEEIITQITADIPLTKLVKEKIKLKHKLKAWEIVLIVLGSPLWLSILIAFFSVILSLYIVLWTVIICFWAVEVSFWASALGGLASGVVFAYHGNVNSSVMMIAGALISAGLSIFMFFGCKASSKGIVKLTKKIAIGIKKLFIRKEEV